MKKSQFWREVEKRASENKVIVKGGVLPQLAPIMESVGLRFWVVGAGLSLVVTIFAWWYYYEVIMRVVRMMIWR